ncbi:MAG: glycosyltransferase family 2 protein [Elusimicrobiales bacterium]
MFETLLIFGNISQFYFLLCMLLYFALSIYGVFLYFLKSSKNFAQDHTFAIVVPAHNEEKVIGNLIESLQRLDYPKEKYDIYIVCNNCSDKTEEIVRGYNLVPLIYKNEFSNKAKALNYAITKIFRDSTKSYDAFCFFDADSLAHPDFLKSMSYMLSRGYKAIQGHQLPKNPFDSFISVIVSVGQYITNRFFQKPKMNLNLSATFHGKGMCFSVDIVRNFRWDEMCLTEDLEMQMNLVKNGIFIAWNEDAIVYDEEPVNIAQYIKRSVRWTKGSLYVARKHAFCLLVNFIRRFDVSCLEAFLYTVGVYRVILVLFVAVSMYLTRDHFNLLIYTFNLIPYEKVLLKIVFLVLPLIFLPVIIWLERRISFTMIFAYYMQPLLGFFRIPIFLMGVLKPNYLWDVVEHSSSVKIDDIVKKGVV